MPGQIRVGDQVLSWGESTFIQNGINVINPYDVSKLRVPGSELKEGLVPVGMVSASLSPTEDVTFEGFYQYDWEKVEIDPTGYYWSTNDFAGKSGDRVLLGFGDWSDLGTSWQGAILPYKVTDDRFMMVPRGDTETPSDDGQYGLAARVYAPGLNNTEFGFYFINYHSRLPTLSGVTGTRTGFASSVSAATSIKTFASNPTPANIVPAITAGTQAGIAYGLSPTDAQTVATGAVNAATTGNAAWPMPTSSTSMPRRPSTRLNTRKTSRSSGSASTRRWTASAPRCRGNIPITRTRRCRSTTSSC